MTEPLWQRNEEWVGTEVEDSFVMIHLDTGRYLTLNSTANAVWSALDTPQTQSAIEQRLSTRFEVAPAECAAAVTKLLARMQELKLADTV